jgi:hypothetical protein
MSCLFNSMSYFIKEEMGPTGIRQRICDYLEKNLPILEGMETRDVLEMEAPSAQHYISNMRNTSTWGGAIEIQCACNIWNARIIVHDIRSHYSNGSCSNNLIEFIPLKLSNASENETQIEVHLEWSGGHYEPRRQ